MIALDDWEELRRRVEQMQRDKDRAEGALSQLASRLKSELGVSSLKEAKKKLAEMEEEERKLAREWGASLKSFRKATEGKLEQVD